MRYYLFILFLLLIGCKGNKESKVDLNKIVTDSHYQVNNNVQDSVFTYDNSSDTIPKESYKLKNNYMLTIYPTKGKYTNELCFRLKGENIDTIIFSESISTPKYNPYYDKYDFRDFFIIHQSGGSSTYFRLFDKKTGKECLYGMQMSFDLKNELILYADENDDYKIYIYDINTKTKTLANIPDNLYNQKLECTKYNDAWKSVYIKRKTQNYYILGIYRCDSSVEYKISIASKNQ